VVADAAFPLLSLLVRKSASVPISAALGGKALRLVTGWQFTATLKPTYANDPNFSNCFKLHGFYTQSAAQCV